MDDRRARLALEDLVDPPLERAPHAPRLHRCWELRENLTVYDAAYVARAEALESRLVTSDTRLAPAPGIRCRVEVVAAEPHSTHHRRIGIGQNTVSRE